MQVASGIARRLKLIATDWDAANQFPKSVQGISRGHFPSASDGPTQEGEIIPMMVLTDFYQHPGSTLLIDRKRAFPCHYYRPDSGCKGGTICPLVHVSDSDTIVCSSAALAQKGQMQNEQEHISDPTLAYGCTNVNCKPMQSTVHGVFSNKYKPRDSRSPYR